MIIELGKYKRSQRIYIDTRTAGSQGHVCYRNGDWRVSVARAAVHMGWKRQGCEKDTGAHANRLRVRNEHRDVEANCQSNQRSISMQ